MKREWLPVAIAMIVTAGVAQADSAKWRQEGLLPETRLDMPPMSAVRWIWNGEEPVRDGGESYFRKTFELSEVPASSRLDVKFDDLGEMWMNGVQVDAGSIGQQLRKGPNLLAIHLANGRLNGGLLFQLTMTFADGSVRRVTSDSSFLSAAKASAGWQEAGFDASAWKPALDQGDVWTFPWCERINYDRTFATAEERTERAKRDAALLTDIPASIAAEPDPVCSITYEGNQPRIVVNGKPYPALLNLAALSSPWILTANVKGSDLGFRFHEVQLDSDMFEVAPGQYDFTVLDTWARRILHLMPDDYLFVRLDPQLGRWCAAHPEETIGYLVDKKSGDEFRGNAVRPSAASKAYREELSRMFAAFGEFVRSRPWAKRVVAVRVCWGVYTEWHTNGMENGPDVGPAMTAAFHAWKGGKWKGAAVPTMEERRKNGALLLDPADDEKTLDYFACMNSCTRALLKHMCREAKRALPGRLAGAYWGYVLNVFPPEGQNSILKGVIDSPEVDFMSAPSAYSAPVRRAGGTYHPRVIADTYRRHGKLYLLEDDMRFHHVRQYARGSVATETAEESRAVMARNYLSTVFDGCGIQLCDPFDKRWERPNTFDDPAVWGAMHDCQRAIAELGRIPADSGNTLVLVVSPRERLRWADPIGCTLSRHISAYLPQYVHAAGVAADFVTLEDFLRTDRVWPHVVFPDAILLTDDEIVQLGRRLGDSKSVWFMREPPVKGANHVRAKHIPEGAQDVSQGSREWAELADELGEHRWTEPGKCFRKHGDLVMMSVPGAGTYNLSLPPEWSGAKELLSGRTYDGRAIAFETKGPDTVFFRLNRSK